MFRALLLLATFLSVLPAQTAADRIFVNGRIWTGNPDQPYAQALAIAADRLIAVGTDAQVRALSTRETAVVDLGGKFVVPGFNDAHWHFSPAQQADLVDAESIPELQDRMRAYARTRPETGWITGRGWGYSAFPNNVPHRKYLDEIFPDRPVFIWERDGHMGLANTAALNLAKLDRNTADPPLGRLERDANGELTGELKEGAVSLVSRLIPSLSIEERYEGLKRLMDRAAAFGLTSVQIASGLSPFDLAAFHRVLSEGSMKIRFYVAVPLRRGVTDDDIRQYKQLRNSYQGPLMKYGSAKGVLDGTVDAKTAAMLEPYVGGANGIEMWPQDELDKVVATYDREGFQVLLHAIGDKAIRMALNTFENAAKVNGTSGRRHRVEHVEVPAAVDIPRFRELGVIASTQAAFCEPDPTTMVNYSPLLGPERERRANGFKQFDDAGAVQAFGSDFPVFSMEVLRGIYHAVTRQTREGFPKAGYFPEQRISVEAALRHFTADAAYASFDEKVKGTLTPGKLADFVVISEDIVKNPNLLLKTKILRTVMGGRDTYRAAN